MNNKFIIEPDANVTYINQTTNEKWPRWKLYKDCTEEEKKKINLASYPSNTILFDRDLKGKTKEEIEKDYNGFKIMLQKRGINSYYYYRSPNGYHVIATFKDLNKLDEDLRKEIRKYYVSLFLSDPAKISDRGVVSLPGRPHFKNGKIYDIEENQEGENEINNIVLEQCKEKIKQQNNLLTKLNKDADFENYFIKDKFFKFIRNNIIPDNTNRDMTIFPNLAIAAVKSGKPKEEIDLIMKPIIKNNFPGKIYQEFEGWLKKALKGQITDYNPIQINNWMRTYTNIKENVYDLTPQTLEELETIKKYDYKFKYIYDDEIKDLEFNKTEWLIDKWLAKGDICFVAGKAASFKTTIMLHVSYCLANNIPVFNKYDVKPTKVLYLNEENSPSILVNMVNRVKKGLSLENDNKKVCFTLMENIKLDNLKHLEELANKIKNEDIQLLVCDSLRRFITFDENNATEMNHFFNYMKLLRKSCPGLTIVILHHLKKANSQYSQDLRDMLRGSSDIVNSADSVIGVSRKHGFNAFKIEHIKNRSGEEITNKLVKIDTGEHNNKIYMYESDKEMDKTKVTNKDEICAEEIIQMLKDKELKEFSRQNLNELDEKFSRDTVTRALRILKSEGTIQAGKSGKGRYVKYIFYINQV